jgi:hypothetical protein
MLLYGDLYRNYQRTGEVSYFRYAPMMVYDLKRNWEKDRASPAYDEILDWVQGLAVPNNPDMAMMRFIAQYALYGIRSKGGGEDG